MFSFRIVMFRSKVIFLVILLTLAGCASEKSKILHKASTMKPWDAYTYLVEAEDVYCDNNSAFALCTAHELRSAKQAYFIEALENLEPGAVWLAFYDRQPETRDVRQRIWKQVVQEADRTKNYYFLRAAALIYEEGTLTIKDSAKSLMYVESAAKAGDLSWAPAKLAKIYAGYDREKAYFWALQCLGQCKHYLVSSLDYFESDLTRQQIVSVQAKAKAALAQRL